MSDPAALVEAMRLFLSRHEEALASGEPSRGMEAAEGLIAATEDTLPGELARVVAASDAQALASAVVEKRIAEMEGLARQLKLGFHQLEARDPDASADASSPHQGGAVDVLRFVALLTATRRQMRALLQTLELWAAAHGGAAPREPPAFELLRAAREALTAGCAAAAREAIQDAARRGGVGAPAKIEGLVEGWAALDDVERALHRKQMGLI